METIVNDLAIYSRYATARDAFLNLVARQPEVRISRYEHPEPGPDGKPLFVDTAWLGRKSAKSVLVLISGTHGVEGIAGSMIQQEWLARGEPSHLPDDVAVLLIHALNPWGFAWLRRPTHENVDLNRNWLDFSALLPGNAAYGEIAKIVEPIRREDARMRRLAPRLVSYALRHGRYGLALGQGLRRIRAAVSGGQYEHPNGLFFGGTTPAWSRGVLTRILVDQLADARQVAIIDFHTGLGRNGATEKMISAPQGSERTIRADQWFGGGITPVGGASSSSASIEGDLMRSVPELIPHAEVSAVALEFGTKPSLQVLQALVADNWLHAHGDPLGPEAPAIKRRIVEAFFDDSDRWREAVVASTFDTCRSVLKTLSVLVD
ncbi:MAG: M14 family metallopeptidase [Methylorubrum populi]